MTEPFAGKIGDRHLAPLTGWTLTLLSWLVPGAGFMVLGRWARGVSLFALIQTPFFIGVALSGSVLPPAWTPGDYGFNIVNSLTFATQMGNGLPSLTWLTGSLAGLKFFQGQEWRSIYDLASFYLMVSGAMNYFSVCNFYDRHVAPRLAATPEA